MNNQEHKSEEMKETMNQGKNESLDESRQKRPLEDEAKEGVKRAKAKEGVAAAGAFEQIFNRVEVKMEFVRNVTDIAVGDDRKYEDIEWDDEKKYLYIDVDDENEDEEFLFKDLGYQGEYSCTRECKARVLLDNEIIGFIEFVLINRDELYDDMEVPCDSLSDELYQISQNYFKPDGSLKGTLKKLCKHDMSHSGSFMYISKIDLKKPYDRVAEGDNVYVGAAAITKLINSTLLFKAEDIMYTLAMYLPDGLYNYGMSYSATLKDLDSRQFMSAGFKSFRTKKCLYMFYEAYQF